MTGWKFGYEGPVDEADLSENPESLLYAEDATAFYQLLPNVLDMFYNQPNRYMELALHNLLLNVPIFNTHRMAAEYIGQYGIDLSPQLQETVNGFRRLYQSEQP
jgi:starch phosphorylase